MTKKSMLVCKNENEKNEANTQVLHVVYERQAKQL